MAGLNVNGMMNYLRFFILLYILLPLAACQVRHEVPVSDDPITKLNWAEELYDKQDRPEEAERLIRESIAICKQTGDDLCLGDAYVSYGFFFRSPSLERKESWFREHGFLDRYATYDSRMFRSRDYFQHSVDYYLNTGRYDLVSRAWLNTGFAYHFLRQSGVETDPETGESYRLAECRAYQVSYEYNLKAVAENPDVRIVMPADVASYREYMDIQLDRAGC
jgi:tetratricopeptide (TPR) repeat protein